MPWRWPSSLPSLGNLNAISDAASSAALARASLTGAGLNVRINCLNLADQTPVAGFLAEVNALEGQAAEKEAELKTSLVERGHLAALACLLPGGSLLRSRLHPMMPNHKIAHAACPGCNLAGAARDRC